MNGAEFIKKVRKLSSRTSVSCAFDRKRGKGSHGTLHYGDRSTVVKDRTAEIGKGLLGAMCRQLGIKLNDLR